MIFKLKLFTILIWNFLFYRYEFILKQISKQ